MGSEHWLSSDLKQVLTTETATSSARGLGVRPISGFVSGLQNLLHGSARDQSCDREPLTSPGMLSH